MNLDYKAIGLKAGLEVHHQLGTDHKLFCRCPVKITQQPHDVEVLRHMRPTLSELGEYDGTALMEFKTKKEVIYQIFQDLDCTYEMDDTPPFLINKQAVKYAIEIALMFNLNLVDELHVSRKQYLDGSIPTGFQRTAIIGVDGFYPMMGKKIGIMHLGLEEDSCREVSDVGHRITFKGDRLGIPLVEVVTAPCFETPEEIGLGAAHIRRILICSQRIRRGAGSGRQDVNVSITGGTRIEIKGVPKISSISGLVKNEAMRQFTLLQIRDELRIRGISSRTFKPSRMDITRLMRRSDNPLIQKSINEGGRIEAIRLTGFGGLLLRKTQENAIFAEEFSGRVRVIACLDDDPNILFPESVHAAGINDGIWRRVRNRLKATHHDDILIVWGNRVDVETAVSEIYIRAEEATVGVPSETRQARKDLTNDFERILPGPDRMYPDTDHPPVTLSSPFVETIRTNLPERPWDKEERYSKMNIPPSIAQDLAIASISPVFDSIAGSIPEAASEAARTMTQTVRYLSRKGHPVQNFTERHWLELFQGLQAGYYYREALPFILQIWFHNPEQKLGAILRKVGIQKITEDDLNKEIAAVLKTKPPRPFLNPEAKWRWVMGKIMRSRRGSIAGSKVSECVRKKL